MALCYEEHVTKKHWLWNGTSTERGRGDSPILEMLHPPIPKELKYEPKYVPILTVRRYLLVPLQKDGAAVLWGPLEAFVDVLHEQVHTVLVQRLHPLFNVAALEGAEHLEHQTFRPFLLTKRRRGERRRRRREMGWDIQVYTPPMFGLMGADGWGWWVLLGGWVTLTHLDVLVLGVDGRVLQHCLQCFHEIPCGETVKEDNFVPWQGRNKPIIYIVGTHPPPTI